MVPALKQVLLGMASNKSERYIVDKSASAQATHDKQHGSEHNVTTTLALCSALGLASVMLHKL